MAMTWLCSTVRCRNRKTSPALSTCTGTGTASLACCGGAAGMRCSTPAPTFLGRCGRPAVLRDVAGHYTLVSTLSVHPDDMPAGSTERAAIHQPPFPQTDTVTDETYGPLKVACEHEAKTAFGNRCLIIRPGYIVGPHDPTDRFTFYLRRAAGGGEMAAPGPPDAPLQV